ncbi:hypothetical protein OsI_21118 [Oryza sativa Indica Group]|uniref:Uncharacterized protein n=1 Tax=Oryza sativa subsp. indica TaxID=39946 RepID=A2Y7U9_ORYSI|nr:hypothetical protein OsI_21118 [Oryza sativa Indica Group]
MGCGKHAKKIQHIPLGKWKVFAIMYMAKIVVTGQELLRKLTVSSLGWKLGWHAENIGHSDTTKGQGKGESACLSSQDDL